MKFSVACPNSDCRKSYLVAESYLGRRGECKQCGTKFTFTPSGSRPNPIERNTPSGAGKDTGSATTGVRSHATVLERLGRFEVGNRVGTGAFGAVYRAYDPQLAREIALKLLHITGDEERDRKRIERFLIEGRAAARLQHPNIVPVFDAGYDELTGEYYQASQFVDGQTVSAAVVDHQPLELRRAIEVVRKLADALHYAHQQKILHRDVKPSNVMLDAADEPHLLDFGLARFEESEEKLTVDGTQMGTPAYMSPEQARGQRDELTAAADQYSLGIMFYELITGHTPFDGPPHIQMHHHINTEPARPSQANPAVPRDLDTICLKAISKEPQRRYPDCAALAEDLRRWLADEPIQARRIGPVERFRRWANRNRAIATLGGTVAALLLVLAVIGPVLVARETIARRQADREAEVAKIEKDRADKQAKAANLQKNRADQEAEAAKAERDRADQEAQVAKVERDRADQKAAEALASSERARAHLYVANMNLAQNAGESSHTAKLLNLLQRQLPRNGERDLRGFEWYYWDRLRDTSLRTFINKSPHQPPNSRSHNSGVHSVAYSPDGRWIASGSSYWITVTGGSRSANSGEIKLWDVETGREIRTLQGHTDSIRSLAFSPDGRLIASGSNDKTIKLWDVETGREIRTLQGHTDSIRSLAFSPDGRLIASSSNDKTIKLWDIESGQTIRTIEGSMSNVCNVAFSPDGHQLVSGSGSSGGLFTVWDVKSGQVLRTSQRHVGPIHSLAFSPDGRQIVSGGGGGSGSTHGEINLWDAGTGEEIRTFQGRVASPITSVAFSPDGRRIVSGSWDHTIKLWDVKTGEVVRSKYLGHTDLVNCVAFSPDGTRIVTGSADRTVKLWNTETDGGPLTFTPPVTRNTALAHFIFSMAFSPDGRKIVSVGTRSSGVTLWEAESGQALRTFQGHAGPTSVVAFSPDGRRIVSGGQGGGGIDAPREIKLWDAGTGEEIRTFLGHTDYINCVAFSPDGRRIVSGGSGGSGIDDPGEIKVWDAETGQQIRAIQGHIGSVVSVAFSPDGRWIASVASRSQSVKLWNAATGQEIRDFKASARVVSVVAFSPDSRLLASGRGSTIMLWDVETGEEIHPLMGHTNTVRSLAFSPDGRRIASASFDNTIKLWDVESGQEVLTLKGHNNTVISVAFSPDGHRIASAGNTIELWDATPRETAPAPDR